MPPAGTPPGDGTLTTMPQVSTNLPPGPGAAPGGGMTPPGMSFGPGGEMTPPPVSMRMGPAPARGPVMSPHPGPLGGFGQGSAPNRGYAPPGGGFGRGPGNPGLYGGPGNDQRGTGLPPMPPRQRKRPIATPVPPPTAKVSQ
jgi:hypothetical protein